MKPAISVPVSHPSPIVMTPNERNSVSATAQISTPEASQAIKSALTDEAVAAIDLFRVVQQRFPTIGLTLLQNTLYALADSGELEIGDDLWIRRS